MSMTVFSRRPNYWPISKESSFKAAIKILKKKMDWSRWKQQKFKIKEERTNELESAIENLLKSLI